jgi:hypothetical protein
VASDVFQHQQIRAQMAHSGRDAGPDVARVLRALPQSGTTERLARVTGGEHVHGRDGGPVGGGDVTEVQHAGVAAGEDFGRGRVDLGVPQVGERA